MDNMESSSIEEEEIERAEIDDLVQALHTWYEFAKMPSMMVWKRHPNGEDVLEDKRVVTKSTSKFNELKNSADVFLFHGQYEYAATTYTLCLKFAKANSEEDAHAYANRSEVFFELGKYKECQLDIDRAMRSNKYPRDEWDTLVERYKSCIKSLRDVANSASSSDQAKNGQKEAVEVKVGFVEEDIDVEWRKLCEDLTNPLLQKTSKKIRLECNEMWGRHMIASEDIKPGEILSCEKYSFLLVANKDKGSRCSYCNTTCCALIPCKSCSLNMYCSLYCRIRAWNLYHRTECQMYQSSKELFGVLMDIDFMALRMLLIGTNQGAGLETLMKKLPMRDIFAEKIDPTTPNKPFTSDYLASLRLRRTFPKPLLDFNSNPGVVVKMILALQKAGYFGQYSNEQTNTSSEKRLSDKELYAALLLVNHRISVPTSTFKMDSNFDSVSEEGEISVGVPILHNMVNHSCNPNSFYMARYHENLLFASRPISKGEQIFVTHDNTNFSTLPSRIHRRILALPFRHFGFTCKCEACIGHWPATHSVDSEQFLGSNLEAEVRKFNTIIDLASETRIAKMSHTEILHLISQVCEWLCKNLARPSNTIIRSSLLLKTYTKFVYGSEERVDYSSMIKELSKQFSDIKMAVDRLRTSRRLNQREGDIIEPPVIRFFENFRNRKR